MPRTGPALIRTAGTDRRAAATSSSIRSCARSGCRAASPSTSVASARVSPADLVSQALLDAGADGVLVNVGGDARVAGESPRSEGWIVEFENPLAFGPLGYARLAGGAVCTSTRTKRKWTRGGEPQHHLIDPATGAPSWSGLASVTVLSSEAWWAEILAKAAFVAGPRTGRALLASHGVTGLLVSDDGRVDELEGLEAFR